MCINRVMVRIRVLVRGRVMDRIKIRIMMRVRAVFRVYKVVFINGRPRLVELKLWRNHFYMTPIYAPRVAGGIPRNIQSKEETREKGRGQRSGAKNLPKG